MTQRPDLTVVASAIGGPARGRMLSALMDGQALTATELAQETRVAPSTASGHLAYLRRAGLVSVTAQGRHRYFRIAGSSIG
jgi:DNA-binding transcriptional ArsR family regulator